MSKTCITGPSWTEEEKAFLKDNFRTMTTKQLVAALPGRTYGSIEKKLARMRLRKADPPEPPKMQRPPAIYSNRNYYQETLNKYA